MALPRLAGCVGMPYASELPHSRTSFKRPLHFRTTSCALIGDILKVIREKDWRDYGYRHLAFAIWAGCHGRHYGLCQLAHDVSFRPNFSGRVKPSAPGLGCLCSLKGRSWNRPGRFAMAARSFLIVRLIPAKNKKTTAHEGPVLQYLRQIGLDQVAAVV